jgi:sirohydrochlorin ferrochelatase
MPPDPLSRSPVLVVAAHGDRGGADPNAVLIRQVSELAARGCFRAVELGLLNGEPSLEAALAAAAGWGRAFVVLPFFMAGGYFAETVLERRIREAGHEGRVRLLRPLGLDPGLPGLIAGAAMARAAAAGLDAKRSSLLLVGHGSEIGPASRLSTEAAAFAIRRRDLFAEVTAAFIEEAPLVAEALAGLRQPTVVFGFLSGDGLHAGEDIPAAIAASRRPALYAGSAGTLAGVPALIEAAVLGGRSLA